MWDLIHWFSGGAHQYHTLFDCMHNDKWWIALTVTLDVAVASGYVLIAFHWAKNAKTLPRVPARNALARMRNIFLFCGVCGYLFIPVKMVWPAWRLYDIVMAFLVYYTWRYAWGAKDLKVVYGELGKTVRLSAELEKSQEESRQKSAFLNALSHDLRTPLNGIALQSQVAKFAADSNDAETVREAVAQIGESARVAADLLSSLLECARLDWQGDPNQEETLDLRDVLGRSVAAVRGSAEHKGLTVELCGGENLRVQTDRRKLERVLSNLLSNAVKFTERGGVRVEVEHAARGLEIHVIDSGVGLSAEQQSRVFEEFFQVNNDERDRSKGFGLGLPISRRLARQLGGDVTVQSAVGAGSRFTLSLPAVVSGRAVRQPSQPAAVAAGV